MQQTSLTSRRFAWLLAPILMIAAVLGSQVVIGQETPDPQGLSLFFMGRRDSKIEPCGCKNNPRGGVQFEARMYSWVPRENSIRLDTGEFTSATITPESSMRTRYLLRAMADGLDMDAVNVSRVDLELGEMYFKDVMEKHPGVLEPLVSANVYSRILPDERPFSAYRMVERELASGEPVKVLITGATIDEALYARDPVLRKPGTARDFLVRDPAEEIGKVIAEKGDEADLIVALWYGMWEGAVALAEANPELDIVISAMRAPRNLRNEVQLVGKTKIMPVHNSEGKELGRADVVPVEGDWKIAHGPRWDSVRPDFEPVDELANLIEEFKGSTTELILQRPRNPKRTFAGARSCATCHVQEYQSWSKTRHAHALQTLVDKGMQYDPSCLKCHTVGFGKDNGFYNVNQSRAMANVQCEVCHGPGAEHVDTQNFIRNGSIRSLEGTQLTQYMARAKAAIPPAEVPASTCLQCHTPDNDDHFVYDVKIHKVNHSDIAQGGGAAVDPHASADPSANADPHDHSHEQIPAAGGY